MCSESIEKKNPRIEVCLTAHFEGPAAEVRISDLSEGSPDRADVEKVDDRCSKLIATESGYNYDSRSPEEVSSRISDGVAAQTFHLPHPRLNVCSHFASPRT